MGSRILVAVGRLARYRIKGDDTMKIRNSFTNLIAALGVTMALLLVTSVVHAKELLVYTAANEALHKAVMDAFQKKYPDMKVESVNLSTGPITQRAIAEQGNPQADVIYMVNSIALEQLKDAGVLEPYEPAASKVLDVFKDPDGFYFGHNASIMGMAINKNLLAERKLPMPSSWDDLIKPAYKESITVASPTESGTGLSILSTMVDMFGWNYVDNLHENILQYNSSGSQAARQAGSGETVVGLSYDTAILQQIAAGLPVVMVTGSLSPNVVEGVGLISGAPNPDEAKLFIDFIASEEGAEVFGPFVGASSVPGYGSIDMNTVTLWEMRRPLDADEFKRQWSERYQQ